MLSLSRLLGRGPVAHTSGRPGPAGPGGEGSGGRRALSTSVTLAVQDDVTPVCSIGLSSCFLPRRHPNLARPPTSASAAAATTAASPPKSFSPPVAKSSASTESAGSRRGPSVTPSGAKATPSPSCPPSLASSTPSTQVRSCFSSSTFSSPRSPSRSRASPGSATPSHRSPKPAAAFSTASAGAGDRGSSDSGGVSSSLPSSSPSPPSSPRAAASSSSSSSSRRPSSSSSLGMSFLRALRLWSGGSSQSAATQRSSRTTAAVSASANGGSAAAAAAPAGAASSAPGVTAVPRAQAAAAAGGSSSASAAAAAAPRRRLRASATAATGANVPRHSKVSSAAATTAGSDSATTSGRDGLNSRVGGSESGRDDWSGGLRRGSASGASELATVPTPHPFFVAEVGVLPPDAAGRRSPPQELEGGGGGRAAGGSRAGVGVEWAAGGRSGYGDDVAGSSTWVLQKEAAALEAVLREARLSVQRRAVGPADSSRYGGVSRSMAKAAPSAPPAQRSSSPSRASWRDTFAIAPQASRSGSAWHNDLTATAASAGRPSSPTLPFRGRFKAPTPSPHSTPSRGPPAAAAVSAAASAFPSAAAATPGAVTAAMQLLDGSAAAVGVVQQPLGLGGSGLYRPLSSLPAAQHFGKPASPGRGRSASPRATTSTSAASIAAGWPAATAEPSSTSGVGSGKASGGLWQRIVDAVGLHKWAWEEWVLCLGLLAAAVGVVVMVAGAALGRQPGMAAPLGGVAYQTRAVSVAEGRGGWAVGGTRSTRSVPMHL